LQRYGDKLRTGTNTQDRKAHAAIENRNASFGAGRHYIEQSPDWNEQDANEAIAFENAHRTFVRGINATQNLWTPQQRKDKIAGFDSAWRLDAEGRRKNVGYMAMAGMQREVGDREADTEALRSTQRTSRARARP
jgi:hypothetical protein